MNSDFVKRGIVLPLVTALAVGVIAFFLTGNYINAVVPFPENSKVLIFDSENSETAVADLSQLKKGDLVGSVSSKEELPLRYEADYSDLTAECSLCENGAALGEIGASYIKILNTNADKFGDTLTVSFASGKMKLKKADEKTAKSETDVLSITPRNKKSVIVYYQIRNERGLSSAFRAIIYEEAA